MNKQLFLDLADVIEADPKQFDMNHWLFTPTTVQPTLNACGTTACVCGWTNFLIRPDDDVLGVEGEYGDIEAAANALGIDSRVVDDRLFSCGHESVWAELADEFDWDTYDSGLVNWSEPTAAQAAEVLRRIADGRLVL